MSIPGPAIITRTYELAGWCFPLPKKNPNNGEFLINFVLVPIQGPPVVGSMSRSSRMESQLLAEHL